MESVLTVEMSGHTYHIAKMPALEQFHIVRRLAPLFGNLPIEEIKKDAAKAADKALPALALAISSLSDSDANYVLFGLLKNVTRKQEGALGWGAISTGNNLMYEDIDMALMLKLAFEVLKFNLSSFFRVLASTSSQAQ